MSTDITHAAAVGMGSWYGFTSQAHATRWAARVKARLEAEDLPKPTIVIVPVVLVDGPIKPLYWSTALERFVSVPSPEPDPEEHP